MDDCGLNCWSSVQILRNQAMYAANMLRDSLRDGAGREVVVERSLLEQTLFESLPRFSDE
jgi:hypothetical protein